MLNVHFFTYNVTILKTYFLVKVFVLNCLFSINFSLKYDLMKLASLCTLPQNCLAFCLPMQI